MPKLGYQSPPALASPQINKAIGYGCDQPIPGREIAMNLLFVVLPLAWLWVCLIDNLRREWSTNPQYGYGRVVPFLCLGLLLRRWQLLPHFKSPNSRPSTPTTLITLVFVLLALLYLPTRLIEEATPEWRPVQWLLGLETVGLTLGTIYVWKGWACLRQLALPICFFFVAIPWPTPIEAPVIQNLTRVSAGLVVEIMGLLSVPAIQHGNVIEISTGVVGVDEACSGIRSLQTSLMISLFFGEFYRLTHHRRLLLVPVSLLLAMAFNVCRMTLLTMIAAKKGVLAINDYHDPAGVSISIACTFALWGVALLLKKSRPDLIQPLPESPFFGSCLSAACQCARAFSQKRSTQAGSSLPALGSPLMAPRSMLTTFACGLLLWLVLVEAGIQLWYQLIESDMKPGPSWSLVFPSDNPTLSEVPIAAATRDLLRYDDARQAVWREQDGSQWQAYSTPPGLPGRVAGYLAKRHTPEICLPAAGFELRSGPELMPVAVHGLELPVRRYIFDGPGGITHVFHCRWEAGVSSRQLISCMNQPGSICCGESGRVAATTDKELSKSSLPALKIRSPQNTPSSPNSTSSSKFSLPPVMLN